VSLVPPNNHMHGDAPQSGARLKPGVKNRYS
jgi:hypothetical protein